jgi:hypothetical protein
MTPSHPHSKIINSKKLLIIITIVINIQNIERPVAAKMTPSHPHNAGSSDFSSVTSALM